MIDIHELSDKFFNSSAYYGTIGALTGGFIGLVGLYFLEEYQKYKKANRDKLKNNLEETLKEK